MTRILKNFLSAIAIVALLSIGAFAQEKGAPKTEPAKGESTATEKTTKTRTEYLPETIEKAQQALKTKGLYKGGVTGKLDAATKDAVKAFQEQQGIKPTGRLNKDTRQALGLEAADSGDKPAAKKRGKAKEPKASQN